jgi:hypothetical protein
MDTDILRSASSTFGELRISGRTGGIIAIVDVVVSSCVRLLNYFSA